MLQKIATERGKQRDSKPQTQLNLLTCSDFTERLSARQAGSEADGQALPGRQANTDRQTLRQREREGEREREIDRDR